MCVRLFATSRFASVVSAVSADEGVIGRRPKAVVGSDLDIPMSHTPTYLQCMIHVRIVTTYPPVLARPKRRLNSRFGFPLSSLAQVTKLTSES